MESVCDFFMRKQSVIIDNYTFRMHYRATTFLLLVFATFIAVGQFLGDPIDCSIVEKDELQDVGNYDTSYRSDIPSHFGPLQNGGKAVGSHQVDTAMLDTFCWVHSTFTYPPAIRMPPDAVTNNHTDHVPHPDLIPVLQYPGLLPSLGPVKAQPRYHNYYKWIPLFLFMQAVTFYFPRFLWKIWEGGKVKGLTDQLHTTVIEEPIIIQKKRHLLEYFNRNIHRQHYYAFKFFFCEIVNLINVIMQIFITDKFLGYQFLSYGSRVVQFRDEPSYLDSSSPVHPMDEVFPKMSRCLMYTLGSSTTLRTHNAFCVLPTNAYNDKIFLFLWFWFVILSLLSGISFFYRLATFSPSFRHRLLCSELHLVDPQAVKIVSRHCNIGDWFMLFILALNMDPDIYKEFFSDLVLKFAQTQPY
ncbi:unnamed protein product [Meganyctiphanes norvegica]|uniref:Innexin n=1 Tax=Meganyctiphanes norvegica TaxID=48144 RepID=A0AAV2RGZ9_MEGNR